MEWTPAQLEVFAAYAARPQELGNVLRLVLTFQDDTWFAWASGWLRAQGWGAVMAAGPRLEAHPLAWYAARPPGSLGRAYHDHLVRADINPNALRLPLHEDERGWLRARTWELHDVVHVLAGFGTSGADEVAVLAFIASQIPARHTLALLSGALATAAGADAQRHDAMLEAITRGHLLARGSVPIVVVDWDALWDVPLDEVRKRVGVRLERLAALD